jgi:hypothetical protein
MYSRKGVKAMMYIIKTISRMLMVPTETNTFNGDNFKDAFSSKVSSFIITSLYLFFNLLNKGLRSFFLVAIKLVGKRILC